MNEPDTGYEGIALEAVAALDEATQLLGAARADAHMSGVLLRAEYQAQIDALHDIVDGLQDEIARKEKVIQRFLSIIDERKGRPSARESLRRRLSLNRLVAQATTLEVAGHGHMQGPCPFCGQGYIHVWLGLHEFWCDCCYQSGDSVAFYELRRDHDRAG